MGAHLSMKKVRLFKELMLNKTLPQLLWFLFFIPSLIFAKEPDEELEPDAIGNFALPFSQQPGPLVSFGQNIIDKGQVQLFIFGDAFIGDDSYLTDITPGIVYGITDDLSLFFNVPLSPGNKDGDFHSAGLEDLFVQFEYAFFTKKTSDTINQATIVANVTFPTGSSSKNPPTGFGSTSFFVGSTFCHMKTDWFFYTSPGAVLTTSRHGTKFGDQLLYEFGLGRNIPSPCGWIFAWQIEFDGLYAWKDRIKSTTDPNSGGNVIYITPSLWASTENLILQLGTGYPALQHLNGKQSKKFLSVVFNFGITF